MLHTKTNTSVLAARTQVLCNPLKLQKLSFLRITVLLLIASITCFGFTTTITLDEINSNPPSREKNFLIWQFLNQEINASQASEAFYQIDMVNERFLHDYAKKTDEADIVYTSQCLQKPSEALMAIIPDDCLYLALSPSKALALHPFERKHIASRLEGKFGDVSWLNTMNQENHFTLYSDIASSLHLFTLTGSQYHQEHFNHTLDPETLMALAGSKNFGALAFLTITDPKMDKLQESLSLINGGTFDGQTHFYLGINALKYKQPQSALFHFKEASAKVYKPIDKDKVTFWLYQTTGEQTYLDDLSNSLDLNMYALWGKEKSGVVPQNYFTTLPMTQSGGFAGDNPFEWNALHKEIISSTKDNVVDLIERYSGENSLAVQAYIIERIYTPLIHNFTMPYDQYMTELSIDQKAMLYALMRQETRMIPGLISRSFALGSMQIMPFNVDTISKAHPLKITSYSDMFNPKFNIAYAISHMKHIDNTLYNPVLKAYAYNGGLGLTKRHILNNGQFLAGNYEPFMSMELVGNHENREYGKIVLANYVIYKKILGEEVSITSLFDSLTQPALSDCFRAKALMPLGVVSQSE